MNKNQDCIRLDPEEEMYPEYDSCSVKAFPMADFTKMGFPVVDNFPKEHIQ